MKICTSIDGKQNKGLSKSSPSYSIAILDVGHGNCTVVIDRQCVIVVDSGPGSSLLEFLQEREITTIDVLLISHADEDHIAGLIQLLSSDNIRIDSIRLNTDSAKGSRIWSDLLYELDRSDRSGNLDFDTSLTRGDEDKIKRGEIQIEILGPSKYLAARGPGSTDRKGRKLTSNSVSVVTRLLKDGRPIALLPGDLDGVGLDNLHSSGVDATAPIVVFPHHGGRTGSADMAAFATKLCQITSPSMVIFSIGRGRHGTPRPEIVTAVREEISDVWIACTQLSEHCAAGLPSSSPKHLSNAFAQGSQGLKCCAGTILIDIDNINRVIPDRSDHQAFVINAAPTALCRSTN